MKEEQVILVNEKDEPIGLMNKLEAHEKAVLHRAFSVFVLMIKMKSCCNNVLITNTIRLCCGRIPVAATSVMGNPISRQVRVVCMRKWASKPNSRNLFHFIYKAPFDNGLTEHELDHVMIGYSAMKNLISM